MGIGGRTVEELSNEMSLDEFLMWAAFLNLEPIGEDRADWRTAMILAQQANMNRGKGKPVMPVQKFLPQFEAQQKRASRSRPDMKRLEAAMQAQFAYLGGKVEA